jgi:hypothetical protein
MLVLSAAREDVFGFLVASSTVLALLHAVAGDAGPLADRRNRRLVRVFAWYCAVVCAYAFGFQYMYLRDNNSLLFADSLATFAKGLEKSRATMRLEAGRRDLAALLDFREKRQGRKAIREIETSCPTDTVVVVEYASGHFIEVADPGLIVVDVVECGSARMSFGRNYGSQHPTTFHYEGPGVPSEPYTLETLSEELINQSLDRIAGEVRKGLKLDAAVVSDPQPAWGLIDFLYFSTATIATVGYGDVVPGTRSARLLAMSEMIIGVFLWGVAINFVTKND